MSRARPTSVSNWVRPWPSIARGTSSTRLRGLDLVSGVTEHVRLTASQVRERAAAAGLRLRLAGSYAIRVHCERYGDLLDTLKRDTVNDLDLVTERRGGREVGAILEDMGYVGDRTVEIASSGRQRYFVHRDYDLSIDVYLGGLYYCHPLELEKRLDVDPVTIPLAELLLSKLQIVNVTEKDLKDVVVLLVEHEVGDQDNETINGRLVSSLLGNNWGFWYTATTNMKRALGRVDAYQLSESQRATFRNRATGLLARIEDTPKSLRWKLRARVGTHMAWYQDVEEKQLDESQ
jgi:hypothetical protein